MTFEQIVVSLQAAISALGAFICLWGFTQFAPCLWCVLTMKRIPPAKAHCTIYAVMSMLCLAGLIFSFARVNTIGFLHFGELTAGLSYIAGMIIVVVSVGLAVVAKERSQELARMALNSRALPEMVPALQRILGMLIIVVMAFLAVGLLHPA